MKFSWLASFSYLAEPLFKLPPSLVALAMDTASGDSTCPTASGNSTCPAAENQDLALSGVSPAVLSGFADAICRIVREEVAAAQAESNPVGGPTPPASTGELLFV